MLKSVLCVARYKLDQRKGFVNEQIAPAPESTTQSTPIFQRIKDYLTAEIAAGRYKEGDVVPSEQALVRQFGVSRMTVNRAVRELTAQQVLTRRQGSGTFVAPQKIAATLLDIRSIADEIRTRGHHHRSVPQRLEELPATDLLAARFGLEPGAPLFHSLIVHFENELPIQVEDRWVNPACAPHYLEQDFTAMTPNEHLTATAPLQDATFSIEAALPPAEVASLLALGAGQPCLVQNRRTRSNGQVASTVTLWHPGSLYQYTGSVG